MDFDALYDMAAGGELIDAKTVAGLMMAKKQVMQER